MTAERRDRRDHLRQQGEHREEDGDLETARQAAAQAKTWLILSVVVGLLFSVGYIVVAVLGQMHR